MNDGFIEVIIAIVFLSIGIALGVGIGEDIIKKQAVAHGYASYSIQDEKFYWKEPTP